MSIISKLVFSLFLFSITTYNFFGQETSISTKFIEDGFLYENVNDFSNPLTSFKENENCIVTDYLGKYIYKIKYKEYEGYVKDQNLIVTESMMDLYFDFEEKQRLKAINEKKNRLKERQEIAKVIESQINNQKEQDSIAKAKEEEQKQIEELKIIREKERKQDSLNNIQLERQKKINSTIKIAKEEEERLKFRNTCHYLINEYDQFYKKQIIITDKYFINQNLNIELLREGNTSKIHINLSENLGCANYVPSGRSSVRITLENNQVIIFYHNGSLDCNDFSLKAIISESKIIQLMNSPIKSINLRGTKKSVTISDIDYRDFFIDKLKCIE